MKHAFAFPILLVMVLTAETCRGGSEADAVERQMTEVLAAEAVRQTGMPGITNFTEKKFLKYLYELRDQVGFSTYTYIVDLNGGLHFVCESIGYGIPYSAQYVNPQRPLYDRYDTGVITQPEPNGLFTPDGLSATWILCSDGEGGVLPVYSEPNLLVTPFAFETSSRY